MAEAEAHAPSSRTVTETAAKPKQVTFALALVFCVFPALFAACARAGQTKEQQPVVIGAESAKAAEAEARRKARGDSGPSPMPQGDYAPRREELGLVAPEPDPYDAALAELCGRYARADAGTRASMRRAISEEEFYKLLGFARREAVFALRERRAGRLADGLTAVAMVERERVDFRDIPLVLSLLYHSASRIGAPAEKLFRDAAALAEPGTARLITDFAGAAPREKDIRESWGYDEVETEEGVGFIGWGFQKYEPTYDLKKVAVEAARLVASDGKYERVSPSIAEEFPRYWLETDDNAALERALASARAGATVDATAGGDAATGMETNMLAAFFVELRSDADARALLDVSKRRSPSDFHLLALAEGRLFCLVVARSYVAGTPAIETKESLRRFSGPLSEIMRRHAKG